MDSANESKRRAASLHGASAPTGDNPIPASKRQKIEKQSSLLNFVIASSKKSNIPASKGQSRAAAAKDPAPIVAPSISTAAHSRIASTVKSSAATNVPQKSDTEDKKSGSQVNSPIIPHAVPRPCDVTWSVIKDCVLIRKVSESPRTKAAAFDLDGTLLVWRIPGWPSRFEHYELWSAEVPEKLRELHDKGYKLVLFSNQGAIRKAFTGKKATTVKSVVNWLAHTIDRPLHVIMSTNKKAAETHHKPSPLMWRVCETLCNRGVEFSVADSFYVGDSVGDDDPQGGVDSKFAENVSKLTGATLKFHTPDDYFGPSDNDKRKLQSSGSLANYEAPTGEILKTRAAWLGGYLQKPILLVLCGAQGSGKSTFCDQLLREGGNHWVHLSQDTISNGKPGPRSKVEKEATKALENGHSVVVDRMHLDELQRGYFIEIAKASGVPAHALLLDPPKDVVAKRVRERTGHSADVQGVSGVRMALGSLAKLVRPKYSEGFALINCCSSTTAASKACDMYRQLSEETVSWSTSISEFHIEDKTKLPPIAFGTMGVGKRIASDVVSKAIQAGIRAVDTAPTYKNEKEVGAGLSNDVLCIIKIPKRATQREHVRQELKSSLSKLGRSSADLLLLHWPSDVIAAGTLESVWEEMEKCKSDGFCKALGVCNFNVNALRVLLTHCKVRPVVNQIERHPLLAQWELKEFCANQSIILQAHTPLGQASSVLLENEGGSASCISHFPGTYTGCAQMESSAGCGNGSKM